MVDGGLVITQMSLPTHGHTQTRAHMHTDTHTHGHASTHTHTDTQTRGLVTYMVRVEMARDALDGKAVPPATLPHRPRAPVVPVHGLPRHIARLPLGVACLLPVPVLCEA